jgi:hypothetical protein
VKLVQRQIDCRHATRHADDEVVAESPERIVKALGDVVTGEIAQVWEL